MNYVVVYTHFLSKDSKELSLIYGTGDGHGQSVATGEFIPFKEFKAPTIIEKDEAGTWQTEVVAFDNLEEALSDIVIKKASFNIQDIEYSYTQDYFGLSEQDQQKILSCLATFA